MGASQTCKNNVCTSRDFLTLSFVFIYILALFPQKTAFSFQPHKPRVADPDVWSLRCPEGTGRASRRLWPTCAFGASQTFKNNVCASRDFLTLSFVFIYILALFREF